MRSGYLIFVNHHWDVEGEGGQSANDECREYNEHSIADASRALHQVSLEEEARYLTHHHEYSVVDHVAYLHATQDEHLDRAAQSQVGRHVHASAGGNSRLNINHGEGGDKDGAGTHSSEGRNHRSKERDDS